MSGSAFDDGSGGLGGFFGAVDQGMSNPVAMGLLGMAQGFGQAAMPSRMPIPTGAVLGAGAGGLAQGLQASNTVRQGEQAVKAATMQNQYSQMQQKAMQALYGNGNAPFGMPAGMSGASGAGASSGGTSPMLAPGSALQMAQIMGMNPQTAAAATPWLNFAQKGLPEGGGTYIARDGSVQVMPNAPQAVGALKAASAQYEPPVSMTVPDGTVDASGNPNFRNVYVPRTALPNLAGGSTPNASSPTGAAPAGGGGSPSGSVMPAADYVSRIKQSESGNNPNPPANPNGSTAAGSAQFINSTFLSTFKQAFPDQAKNMSDDQIMALQGKDELQTPMTIALAQQNSATLQAAGVPPVGATLALAHHFGSAGAVSILKTAQQNPNTPMSAIMPQKVMDQNPDLQNKTVGQVVNTHVMRFGIAPVDFGGPVNAPPASSGGASPAVAGAPAPVGGMPQSAAGAPSTGGVIPPVSSFMPRGAIPGAPVPTPSQKPFDLRPGGYHIDPQTGQTFKNPTLLETVDANGNTVPMHVIPAPPGAPPGTPGTATPIVTEGSGKPVVTKLPQQLTDARNKAAEDFVGKDTDSYVAAQNTQGWLRQIDRAADQMNQAGDFYMTGPNAQARYGLMSHLNDVASSLGLKAPFDQSAVASWQELNKATTTAGFELSSHYEGHARQAASTIENATSAVPGTANTPIGQKLVTAGIREGAQAAIDMHEYKQGIFNQSQGADLPQAEVDFFNQYKPSMYSDRAISTVHPVAITDPKQFLNYLPGTYITLPNGKISQVPMRPGAPPIPSYLSSPVPPPLPQAPATGSTQ